MYVQVQILIPKICFLFPLIRKWSHFCYFMITFSQVPYSNFPTYHYQFPIYSLVPNYEASPFNGFSMDWSKKNMLVIKRKVENRHLWEYKKRTDMIVWFWWDLWNIKTSKCTQIPIWSSYLFLVLWLDPMIPWSI